MYQAIQDVEDEGDMARPESFVLDTVNIVQIEKMVKSKVDELIKDSSMEPETTDEAGISEEPENQKITLSQCQIKDFYLRVNISQVGLAWLFPHFSLMAEETLLAQGL